MIDQNEDLYGRVRAQFEPVRMAGDLDAVTARGGALRRRRRVTLPAVACLAVAAALTAALNPPAVTPAPAPMELAAWSVEPEPDGTITLTVRQLLDRAGLEARLNEAGVPARIDFRPAGSPDCAGRRDGLPALHQVIKPEPVPDGGVFHIHPSAMPPETVLYFSAVAAADGTFGSVSMSLFTGEPPRC